MELIVHALVLVTAVFAIINVIAIRYAKRRMNVMMHIMAGNIIPHVAEGKLQPSQEDIKHSKKLWIRGNHDKSDPHKLEIGMEAQYLENVYNFDETLGKFRVYQKATETFGWCLPQDVTILE